MIEMQGKAIKTDTIEEAEQSIKLIKKMIKKAKLIAKL